MGITDNIKAIYSSIEDHYYTIVEKLGLQGLTDRIDSIFPSFPLLILGCIVLILLLVLGAFLLAGLQGNATLTVLVTDSLGNPLPGVTVKLGGLERSLSQKTLGTGQLTFEKIPLNANITVEAEKKDYKTERINLVIDEAEKSITIKMELVLLPQSIQRIEFTGANGKKLAGARLSIEFECSSGTQLEKALFEVSTGELEIMPPSGCGSLTANVVAAGYRARPYLVAKGGGIIQLEPEEVPLGGIVITVRSVENNAMLEGMKVTIHDSYGAPTGNVAYTSWGEASFQLTPGIYSAVVEDMGGDYAAETMNFQVSAGTTKKIEARLSKSIKAVLSFTVIDAATRLKIAGATVFLRKWDNSLAGAKTTDENNLSVSFPLKDGGAYSFQASAENYLTSDWNSLDVVGYSGGEEVNIEIALKKCTPSSCGIVKVRVIDEDGLPVENAKVILMDPATDFWLQQYGSRTTDVNGYTAIAFRNVAAGRYYAAAQKYPSYGESDVFTAEPLQLNEITMTMQIGEGRIEIEALDPDGKALPFATAELRLETGSLVGTLPLDADGKGSYSMKADKRIYAVIKNKGYTSYTSTAIQILPDETVTIKAVLEEEITGTKPRITFLGFYNELGSTQVKNLAAGNSYRARLRVAVPAGVHYDSLGVFIMVGNMESVEKDRIYINHINAPNAQQLRGTTYNPPKGSSIDSSNITNGDAKWVQIIWREAEIEAGIYNIEAEVKIRKETPPGQFLPFHYRVWAVEGSNYLRDPIDVSLGNAHETGSKEALYAETYEKDSHEGSEELCDEDFCYSERLLDSEAGLYMEDKPYQIKVYQNYMLEFSITNNSQTVHDRANLRIKNTADGVTTDDRIRIKSYKITNADAQLFESGNETYEIEAIGVGSFRQNKSVSGELIIEARALEKSAIQLVLVSEMNPVMEKMIQFAPVKQADLNVTVKPDVLAAFTPIDLNVHVGEAGGEAAEIRGAVVRIMRTTPNKAKTTNLLYTDAGGNARILIPASSPKTKITIEVEKPGYGSTIINREISGEIVKFNPGKIQSTLDLTEITSEQTELEITNLVPIELSLTKAVITGEFIGLLDDMRMNNWLKQYPNSVKLKALGKNRISVLTAISDDAMLLDKPKEIDASLILNFTSKDSNSTWSLSLPVKIRIELAQPPKEKNCLIVELTEWKDSTINGRATVEFALINSCRTKSSELMVLRNLQARVLWKGEGRLGEVELTAKDTEGSSSTDVLQSGIWTNFFETVKPGAEYVATLTFVPKPGSTGKTAEFEVEIDAELMTSAGKQLVGASSRVMAEIAIVELENCIKFKPQPDEGVIIHSGEEEATLSVDSSACGSIEIDFHLCRNDEGCAGGAGEGEIELMPDKFSLGKSNPSKNITIRRVDIPGMYGIPVYVRTKGSIYHKIALVDVIIEPNPSEYAFSLDKYEFTIKGTGAKDSTELTNNTLTETVEVDASICDWGDAEDKSGDWFNWRWAGIGAVIGALKGMKPAMEAAKESAKAVATTTTSALANAQDTSKSLQAASMKTQSASEYAANMIQIAEKSAHTAQTSCCPCCLGACASTTSAAAGFDGIGAEAQAAVESANTANQIADAVYTTYGNFSLKPQGSIGVKDKEVAGAAYFSSTQSSKPPQNSGQFTQLIPYLIEMIGTEFFKEIAEDVAASKAAELATQSSLKGFVPQLTAAYNTLNIAKIEGDGCEGGCILGEKAACKDSIEIAKANIASAIEAVNSAAGTSTQGVTSGVTAINATKAAGNAYTKAGLSLTKTFENINRKKLIGMLSLYTAIGFVGGGLLGGLFGKEACKDRYSSPLMDYIINLAEDRRDIETGNALMGAQWDADSLKVIGEFERQKIGVVFENLGLEEPEPVYATVKFPAVQHLHSDPTRIARGNSNFGPWNVPDAQTNSSYNEKMHLKFRTMDPVEALPSISFDTLPCVAGVETGRTGAGALPKVKLSWSWKENGIGINECDANMGAAVYCDAAQFTIMLNKRLKALYDFFEQNPRLECPANEQMASLKSTSTGLDVNYPTGLECWIDEGSGIYEGRPAIMYFIEANEQRIKWTSAIPDKKSFLNMIYFNAYLMEDAYNHDFMQDFSSYYSKTAFADTPSFFHSLDSDDATGELYGFDRLFEQGRVSFTQMHYESSKLPAAGIYQVFINIDFEGREWRFFRQDRPAADIKVVFYHLQDPQPTSPFYSLPFDGLVGLEGAGLNRQGYGTAYENSAKELLQISEEAAPVKTYTDVGSNPLVFAGAAVERGFYRLNSSPTSRGALLIAEKRSPARGEIVLQPSRATPLLLKVMQSQMPEDSFSIFYTLKTNDAAVSTGSSLAYWNGAGNCLDFSGELVTNAFFERRDRAATAADALANWMHAYGLDWDSTNYLGDVYLRTIFYTNPLENTVIQAEQHLGEIEFYTPDGTGSAVQLNGIGSMEMNNPAGGSAGSVDSVHDVFELVRQNAVCVSSTGNKAKFWWNPQHIYTQQGSKRSIHAMTEGLGSTAACIGYH